MTDLRIICGDALTELRRLPEGSVHCCVTSPPYWGLRDYGVDGQIGLEKTPEEWCAKLTDVFREVRRVLHPSGTLWLNCGDAYCGGGNYRGVNEETLSDKQRSNRGAHGQLAIGRNGPPVGLKIDGLKPKDLIGLPWMLAFALRADGWWLRSEIIWHKLNPMPESVTDRPTKSHEQIFLLSKEANYFYDAEAIKEQSQIDEHGRYDMAQKGIRTGLAYLGQGLQDNSTKSRSNRDSFKRNGSKREQSIPSQTVGTHRPDREESGWDTATRNKRTVWTVATQPYSEAHFATFPPDLIKPCILAGCPAGGTVLDPFLGIGTTAAVALELGRSAIGIELSPEYVKLAQARCAAVTPGFQFA